MKKSISPDNSRRSFLQKITNVLFLLVAAAFIYPLIGFLGFKVPKKPRKIKVDKILAAAGFHIDKEFILFNHPESPWAVSRKCTHLGCRLNINENEKMLICPCHQSKFDYNGKLLHGPAKMDLARYKVEPLAGPDGKGFLVII